MNGTAATWTFDANSRVTNLKHATTGMVPATFQEWDYRYTAADDPLVQDDVTPGHTALGEAYQYDGLHRLRITSGRRSRQHGPRAHVHAGLDPGQSGKLGHVEPRRGRDTDS